MALNPSTGWQYYKQITVSDPSNVSANYQMKLKVYSGTGTDDTTSGEIYCNNHCNSFPDDIRFGTTNDPSTATQLSQWIETSDTSSAIIWVKLPSDGSNTFYMFVGNSSASQYSSGNDTFIWYIDKNDTSDWTANGYTIEENDNSTYIHGSIAKGYALYSLSSTISDTTYIVQYKYKVIASNVQQLIIYRDNQSTPRDFHLSWSTKANNDSIYYRALGNDYVLYDYSTLTYYIYRIKIDRGNQKISHYLYSDSYSSLSSATNKSYSNNLSNGILSDILVGDGSGSSYNIDFWIRYIFASKWTTSTEPSWNSFGSWVSLSGPTINPGVERFYDLSSGVCDTTLNYDISNDSELIIDVSGY